MTIRLENIGKQFLHKWVFRHLDLEFQAPGHYGISGNNGSGKSTLLKIIAGYLNPNEGKIHYLNNQALIGPDVFRHLSIASPHLELIEDLSLIETFEFHQKLKPYINNFTPMQLIEISGLGKSMHKPLKYFSSGMKQRIKLLLAVMSNNPILLLDEPCTNLDQNSIQWYQKLIIEHTGQRLLIIASNAVETECFSCTHFYRI
jgi:ABC-2 type transport system ATP-binding protein